MELGSKDSGSHGDQTQPGLNPISIIGLRYLSHDTNECASQFVALSFSIKQTRGDYSQCAESKKLS